MGNPDPERQTMHDFAPDTLALSLQIVSAGPGATIETRKAKRDHCLGRSGTKEENGHPSYLIREMETTGSH